MMRPNDASYAAHFLQLVSNRVCNHQHHVREQAASQAGALTVRALRLVHALAVVRQQQLQSSARTTAMNELQTGARRKAATAHHRVREQAARDVRARHVGNVLNRCDRRTARPQHNLSHPGIDRTTVYMREKPAAVLSSNSPFTNTTWPKQTANSSAESAAAQQIETH